MEALLGAHFLGSVTHSLHHALCQRLGHIADAQTDDFFFRVCFLIRSHLVGNVHEQVAGLQLVVMLVHLHDTFPRFYIVEPSQSSRIRSMPAPPRGELFILKGNFSS